jgi:glutamyl-Q tRNA(Asp) synthetase
METRDSLCHSHYQRRAVAMQTDSRPNSCGGGLAGPRNYGVTLSRNKRAPQTVSAVFRFAPSPNGDLHLGHALSALDGYEQARACGGRFLLRIEDIDAERCREPFIAGIYQDLEWLGLTWEQPVLRQSEHFSHYQSMAAKLDAKGLLYPCFATRTEIEACAAPGAVDPDGVVLYCGLHRGLSKSEIDDRKARGQRLALRLDMDRALEVASVRLNGQPLTWRERDTIQLATPAVWGDAVIVRKDTPASYHLAVVSDDARQGITHVTRGQDLFQATSLHRLLQVLLDLPEPIYGHHRLLMDPSGRKLSKSAAARSIRSMRDAGATPEDIRSLAGFSAK